MKKVAIFDIDGTVFRSSLLIELTNALIQEGIFNSKVSKLYARNYKNWLNRKGPYWGKMVSTLFFFKFKLIFDIETIGESFDELDKTTQLEFML